MKYIDDLLPVDYHFAVTGITDDSRQVQEGFIFVATKGFYVDHYCFIQNAIDNGCCFLVVDRDIDFDFPHIVVENIDSFYKELCIRFYDVHMENFHFIGITGTDGKTTTSSIVEKIVDNCAYIGTNGVEIGTKNYATNNTTPCVAELYSDLQKIQKENYSNVVMEVSSEALLHDRVDNFQFDIVAFTNITGDHLNVHGSFDNYVNSKLKLLNLLKKDGIVVVNGDDVNLQNIKCQNLFTFGFLSSNDFTITSVEYLSNYVNITVLNENNEYHLKSYLKGKHNVYNVVLAFIIGLFYGVPSDVLIKRIEKLNFVKGRCELLNFGQNYTIVLDYAHTINGISNILDTFRDYKRIITVTGSAGGRDHEKRFTIGNMVMNKSTISIFTMDDPRYENVDDIIDEMVGERNDYVRILNRREAIYYALQIAEKDDVVLILGKGRDSYMAIEDKKVPYSDYDVICDFFNNSSSITS